MIVCIHISNGKQPMDTWGIGLKVDAHKYHTIVMIGSHNQVWISTVLPLFMTRTENQLVKINPIPNIERLIIETICP